MSLLLSPVLLAILISLSPIAVHHYLGSGCSVSKKDAINRLQRLFMIGDPEMMYPEKDADIDTYCRNMKKDSEQVSHHTGCLPASARFVFSKLANGYLKETEKRCANNSWRQEFLHYSQCMRSSDAGKDIHQCGYRVYDVNEYAIENVPVKHQLQLVCCGMQYVSGCIAKYLRKNCGENVVSFGTRLFWEPVYDTFVQSCHGIRSLQQCQKLYPKEMKDIGEMFQSTVKLSSRNLMVKAYEVHVNRGFDFPEYVDIKSVDK